MQRHECETCNYGLVTHKQFKVHIIFLVFTQALMQRDSHVFILNVHQACKHTQIHSRGDNLLIYYAASRPLITSELLQKQTL